MLQKGSSYPRGDQAVITGKQEAKAGPDYCGSSSTSEATRASSGFIHFSDLGNNIETQDLSRP